MIGVFSALDALLFYVFFEAMLIPMFLVIGMWGGPRRVYATIKFFLYTFLGSVFMLIGLIYLYIQSGTWSILEWHQFPLEPGRAEMAVPGLPGGVLGENSDVAGTHLVAGRARRGADRRFGDPGRDHVENRWLRFYPFQPADHSGCIGGTGLADHHAVADCRGLYRFRRPGAAGHEEAHCLFIDLAHGFRHAGHVYRICAYFRTRRAAGVRHWVSKAPWCR